MVVFVDDSTTVCAPNARIARTAIEGQVHGHAQSEAEGEEKKKAELDKGRLKTQ